MIKKIKIIGNDGVGWSIDKDREHTEFFLKKIENIDITSSFFEANVLYFVWYNQLLKWRYSLFVYKKIFNKKIVAVITNDIRNHSENYFKLKNVVDIWVSPNSKISKFLEENNAKYIQIPFYVSPEKFFKIEKSKKEISEDLGIDFNLIKDKIIVGSFQRDSLGTDLQKPKWQKNPDLLIKILKEIPREKIVLVLAGPRRHYIISQCKKYNIPYIFVGDKKFIDKNEDDIRENNLSEEKINILYNLIDVYLVTSKSEGGPKSIIESLLTETSVYSTDVGLSADFLPKSKIFSDTEYSNVLQEFCEDKKSYADKNLIDAKKFFSIDNYVLFYKKLIREI